MIWFSAVGLCCYAGWGDTSLGAQPSDQATPATEEGREDSVYLYFIAPGGRYLTGEIRNIENSGDTASFCRLLVEALVNGPGSGTESALIPILDPETQVLGVYIDDAKTAFVDLAETVRRSHPGGVRSELLTVYAIVNTLVVNADGVDRVKIVIGGNEAETLAGHIDIGRPVNAHMLLVR
ncbi:MAG: GerMN domain-containing protein [Desulfosalsimonadaceae bacterium]